ncbi:rRNA maturation RNase YbeY [Aeromicrobium sp. Root495]|uniref:rRNA maturation RNase YbeY n=1 Tax=Aeromicrobium sp. Root495 TaxID=1736550 RepID=UPI0006FE27B9|nr:rRNA maturation RNase YbeY [Aeromicrobium sp. Root495]KQY58808.1 rRNA maturation RNase YbeY [Aeromicrobium sp. Root495]
MNVDVLDESGSDVALDVVALTRLSRFVMRRMRLHPATELTVRLVDTATIATLNEQWMGKKGPTDVLSFPMDELTPGRRDAEPEDEPEGYLGDIALCPQVAAQQAPAAGHSEVDEVELLLVHGILHLLGYDHATPEEHQEMFGIQGRLLLEWQRAAAGLDPESA